MRTFTRGHMPQVGVCFVIMPFGEKELPDGSTFDWDEHWRLVLEPTISGAEMTPKRADEIYGARPLLEKIWKGIQEAEVVLADLTGRSPNVLYELGLANVIGKRILILTQDPNDVPTDLADYFQIRYSTEGVSLLQFTRELVKNLEAARQEPATEMELVPIKGTDKEPIRARVISVATDFAIVQTPDGRRGILNSEDLSWVRRGPDLTKLLREDQELDGAFIVVRGESRYSLTAIQENPWPKLQEDFEEQRTFQGRVKAHPPSIGAFVSIRYAIDGLIPEPTIPPGVDLAEGTNLEASVVRIDEAKREVELRFVRLVDQQDVGVAPQKDEGWGPYEIGQRFRGSVAHQAHDKGFILVKLSDGFTALLPAAKMSQALREAFDDKTLCDGDELGVEVVEVDERRQRLVLRDVPLEELDES